MTVKRMSPLPQPLWQSTYIEDSPTVLVRPLLSIGLEPYHVILLAIPNEEFGMISSQVEGIEPIPVNGDVSCPPEKSGIQMVASGKP